MLKAHSLENTPADMSHSDSTFELGRMRQVLFDHSSRRLRDPLQVSVVAFPCLLHHLSLEPIFQLPTSTERSVS